MLLCCVRVALFRGRLEWVTMNTNGETGKVGGKEREIHADSHTDRDRQTDKRRKR